jgi:hypothetical protein
MGRGKKRGPDVLADGEIRLEVLELIQDAIARGTPFTFRALGGSMFPIIPGGTEVTVERIDRLPPPLGTICVALRGGRLFCHRLVDIRETPGGPRLYILRGDSHRFNDEPFVEGDIVGRVTALRYGPVRLGTDTAVLAAAGKLWMRFPAHAIAATRLGWMAAWPARKAARALRRLLDLAGHGHEDH